LKLKNDVFYNNKIFLEITPSIGKRISKNNNTDNQIKIKTIASYLFTINTRNSIFLKNEFGHLNSNNYLSNELFRIGGTNSIRGFTEQSIYTKEYTFFNIEYRYLTSNTSYLYSITDIGKIKEDNKQLLSYGIGYLFKTKNSQININLTTDKKYTNKQLSISWLNIF